MKKLSIFLLAVLFFTTASFAQKLAADQIFKENSEICFYFFINENTDMNKISSMISIDKVEHYKALAYASKKEFEQFLSLEIPYYLLPSPSQLATGIVMNDNVDLNLLDEWDFYPTYEEYVELMFDFATLYPNLCEIIDFGTTTQGRQLLVAHINNDLTQQGEPQFLYTSTMHGDETAGFVMMLNLIDYLLSNYGAIDQVTDLVNTLDIYINPNANPDGTYRGGNNTVQGATRYNANNVDLNRNYPDPEDGPHPDGNEWQPETLAFMALAEAHDFVMAANFHGGAEVVNYPFDTWPDLHADDLWWQFVSHEYADSCQTYSPTGYMSGFNDGITNGYAWYTTNGCRQDYMNYFHHCREATIEISNTKLVPASQLTQYWEYNQRSLLNFMQQALYGVHGQITDVNTSLPLNASVVIENHDLLESHVFSNETTGDYHRPIKAGTYDFTFQA
ncbi:MAG TPA: M14 family zinc carboxypeptidase, partial [Bacteroidales bacterium]|nr:M14 family zinc carboxypeptidase [Bacteroidales bacterium]